MGILSIEAKKGIGIKDVTLGVTDALELGGISQYRIGRYNSDGPEVADVIITPLNGSPVVVLSVDSYLLEYRVRFEDGLMIDSGRRVGDILEDIGIEGIGEFIKKRAHRQTPSERLEQLQKGVHMIVASLTRRLFRGFSS